MSKALSIEDLRHYKILVQKDSNSKFGYSVMRVRPDGTLAPVRISTGVTHHKYGKDLTYYSVSIVHEGKKLSFTLQRLVYATFKGPIPENMDVDHIDGNTLNNDVDNLQLLTRKENLAKRKGFKNHYGIINNQKTP